jgi:DNA polymerase/3'-5' exonuclease PolX
VSASVAIPRAEALRVAESLRATLYGACDRIEIAGSIRREKPQVHDIEIVVMPRIVERSSGDIWGTETYQVDETEEAISALLTAGTIAARPVENHRADGSIDVQFKLGRAFKALIVEGIPLDLFIAREPATWGVIFGLRTGPGDWNTRLVMDCKAIGRRVEGGQVVAWTAATNSWEPVPTPEEDDFFRAIGQSWIEPWERHVSRVAIRREIAARVPA